MTLSRARFGLFLVMALAAGSLFAQPYGAWMTAPASGGYLNVPHSPDFNFSTGFTFEAWVSINATDCRSIAGKKWTETWWVGDCGGTLRSYLKGSGSLFDAGTIPSNVWTHIAVVYDGVKHYHYIDGELVGSRDETGPMPTNSEAVNIMSDVNYRFTPQGAIDEVRIWNVARTKEQIRQFINLPINSPQAGLVAVYHLNGDGFDAVGGHTGSTVPGAAYLTFPAGGICTTTATTLCLANRFSVQVNWTAHDATTGTGKVVPGYSTDSGLFWFFSSDNWELLVKDVNGCGLNNRKWIFSAATTDVHYKMTVFDFTGYAQKIYFNYEGAPAPAITDTGAFATCP